MPDTKPQILLTNDDGIDSPGLWAAAKALSALGYVWVAAPRDQASNSGRSMPLSSDGRITVQQMVVDGQAWTVHAVGGSPAQTVQHGILEIVGQKPDLVVSGINYGLNLGNGITISGTVGAAMEAAAFGIPALAVSLETDRAHFYTHSDVVDFSKAAYHTAYFAERLLNPDLDLGARFLKVEVPNDATEETPWQLTRLSQARFYIPGETAQRDWDKPHHLDFDIRTDVENFSPDSDVYVVMHERNVAVTPLTLDMTANVSFDEFEREIKKG
ncbi:MAG TPA: 5'/3'-nucleotidase SurE [Anaerolineales bacterium]|nr:5'/3'-nucleotidase SurE [Anaerolineales bacterium]